MDVIRSVILKNWVSFLKDSKKARDRLIADFEKTIKKFDLIVEEQRQATILLLKKALSLKDGDEIELHPDGSYQITDIKQRRTFMEEKNENTEELTLNGKPITREELEKQKEMAASQKGVKLEETAKGQFSMRIQG